MQVVPLNPPTHRQVNEDPLTVQIPLFWHGLGEHGPDKQLTRTAMMKTVLFVGHNILSVNINTDWWIIHTLSAFQ